MNGKRTPTIIILGLIYIALAGIIIFLLYTYPQCKTVTPATNVTSAKPAEPSYSNNIWKVWKDGDFSKADNKFYGYEMEYPRDFDVFRLDTARGGFLATPRVTLAFPEDAFKAEKTNFSEAYVAISVGTDPKSINDCYQSPDQTSKLTTLITINGIDFHTGKFNDAAAGNLYNSEIYRTLSNNRCYEIALTVHTGNIANYDPGTVTEFDQEKAFSLLRRMLQTFSFTNQAQ